MNLTILASSAAAAKRGVPRPAYYFEGTEPPECFAPPRALDQPSRQYRNPIALAQEWQRMLDKGECALTPKLDREPVAAYTTGKDKPTVGLGLEAGI